MQQESQLLLRAPAEIRFAAELEALVKDDHHAKPLGWLLSPRAVRTFVLGSEADRHGKGAERDAPKIARKFYGDDGLVERAIVTLMGNRGLLLIGEPGTAKSLLSELLCAAICGTSTRTVQGTAGTTQEQIKYSWNESLLLAEGPSLKALVPAPMYTCLAHGQIMRFEEIARCPPFIQDALISVLSDKILFIPELKGEDGILMAKPGFNLVATANTRDQGVHEMSAALKRRFNFETVAPLTDKAHELAIVQSQSQELLAGASVNSNIPLEVLDLLVTSFLELRLGRTSDGAAVEKPQAVMSTAEAISVTFACGLEAYHFGDGEVSAENVAHHLVGTVLKDSAEDAKRLRHYFDVVVRNRAQNEARWKAFYDGGRALVG